MTGWTADLPTLTGAGRSKEITQFLRELKKRGGWVGRRTSNCHVRLRHVSGGEMTASSTPSDVRTVRNARALARRIERGEK